MRDANRDWKRVSTGDGGLSLLLPPGWDVETPDGTDAVLIASPRDDADPVVVVTREAGFTSTAAEYCAANVIYLQERQSMPDFADHGGGRFDAAGQEIAWHAYSYGTNGGRLRVTIFCATGAGAAYLVNCGVREDRFRDNATTINTIGQSIRTNDSRAGRQ